MTFPNYEGKHLHESLFSADDYVKYREIDRSTLPTRYVLSYHHQTLEHFKRKYKGKYKVIKLSNNLTIHKIGKIGFVTMTGIGAPHAVTYLEELIALGGKEFISMGTAGGLQRLGVFLCDRAIRDEGTSSHYRAHTKYSYPDKSLTARLGKSLKALSLDFSIAPTWTIDAPYRETKKEIEQYHKEGVATVEMEASALFVVGDVRKVKVASVFVVSDVLDKKWDPLFHTLNLKETMNKLVDASIDCLS